jgi:single-stranded-DNA-specific exonuclease
MSSTHQRSIWRARSASVVDGEDVFNDYPAIIGKLLLGRGFKDKSEVQSFFQSKISDLKDPLLMKDMEKAVQRLVRAFEVQEKVCVYADFDLDGTSGLALLADGLRQLGFKNVFMAQPRRLSDGYGFHSHIVEELAHQGVSCIVTVDVGITANEAVARAGSLGIDVIVTDHHQAGETLPAGYAVINPNQAEDTSGLGYLCGAGVAFYLLRALKRGLVNKALIDESTLDLRSVLDCFCIATLTDMVPLIGDNRALVKQGLYQLEHTQRPGLRSLLEALGLTGRSLSSQDVAIRFAPKLNALSRMETGILPIDLYVVRDASLAEKMVKTVLKNNSTRVQLQAEAEAEALEALKSWPHSQFVFLASQNFHRGIVGLIATKICQQTGLPTFIGSISEEGSITGSARLPAGRAESLLEPLQAAASVLLRFGGHDAAAGFELESHRQEEMTSALAKYYDSRKSLPLKPELTFDVAAELSDITDNLMRWLDSMGPFGTSFAIPTFQFRELVIKNAISLKGGHLKLVLMDPRTLKTAEALCFSPPSHWTLVAQAGQQVDLLAEAQWNYFAGSRRIQLLVKDIQSTETMV